jgi:hypothetical protein
MIIWVRKKWRAERSFVLRPVATIPQKAGTGYKHVHKYFYKLIPRRVFQNLVKHRHEQKCNILQRSSELVRTTYAMAEDVD